MNLIYNQLIFLTQNSSFIDIGAYSFPIVTSIRWLNTGNEPSLWIISFTNFLLNFKFLLFFRVFPSFGKYFIIITGVAKEVFPFLVVLWFIVFGFAHAFFILLRSTKDNDLTNTYTNEINGNPTLYQIPDSNTNMFNWFPTSLLAIYLFLTGNNLSC